MAETLSEIFERMLQKQQILVDKYHALEEKNKELSNGRIELENRIRKQKSEIERLQIENQYLKIARTIQVGAGRGKMHRAAEWQLAQGHLHR